VTGPRDKLTCPRCGAPSSELSILCERHRLDAAARSARWVSRRRPGRRGLDRCAFCGAPSSTYRCAACAAKRRRWDAGQPIRDLAAEPAQQELAIGAPLCLTDAGDPTGEES
jgi:hypothetical protein